jgi:hypothetical protein
VPVVRGRLEGRGRCAVSSLISTKSLPGRHCVCGQRTTQPPRSPRAVRVAERLAELGLPPDVPLHAVTDPALREDLGTMDAEGLHRVCGWPRTGRKPAHRWAS